MIYSSKYKDDKISFDLSKYKSIYTADFETSTPEWNVDKARVWLWDICDEKLNHTNGIDIFSFFFEIMKPKYNDAIIGFRNIGFDGFYILNFLLENGFEWHEKLPKQAFTFSTVITDMGLHYVYRIRFQDTVVTLFDTFKHFHQSIGKSAETYGLPIEKGKIDYKQFREEGHTPTQEELKYIQNDTEIDMRCLLIDIEQNMTQITQTGNCKKLLKKKLLDFKTLFPQLEEFEDSFCRKAYRGGFTYLNKKHFNEDIKHMISLDINSMYPAQMLHAPMPIGYPIYDRGCYKDCKFKKYNLFIQRITCIFELKENGIPTISKRSFKIHSNDLYLTSSEDNVYELCLSSPDLELFFDNYNIYCLEYIDYLAFESVCGKEINEKDIKHMTKIEAIKHDGVGSIFYDYLLPLRITKETSEGAVRDNAKRMQNIVYGAFASSPNGDMSVPYINEKGLLAFKHHKGDKRKTMYIPVAVFITAWSRKFLIDSIKKVQDRFVYCDTDSLYLLGWEKPELPIHNSIYGKFKIEHIILKARFLGPKRYIYFARTPKDSKIKKEVACCGATSEIKKQMCFANFSPNQTFEGKLQNKTVLGGKHLVETTYKLKI